MKTVGHFAITLYVLLVGILQSHNDWCWCSKSNVRHKTRVLSCSVLSIPEGTNFSAHHFPQTEQQLLKSYPHQIESNTLLFNKRRKTCSNSVFLDLYWISLAGKLTSSRIWCFLWQCGINTECHTGWPTKCHTIDCTHNKFLLLQKNLTYGTELILIGWKIVPNESL